MFRGFIVVGVTFGIGYSLGYLKGQEHTDELKAFIRDLRDSEETKEFIVELRDALRSMPKDADEGEKEEESATEADIVATAIETPVDPSPTTPTYTRTTGE
jgi:hypothetical protein